MSDTLPVEFFDSNVLVAASVVSHLHHEAADACLTRLQAGSGACATHTLAEAYRTLTDRRRGYSVPPQEASALLRELSGLYRVVSLSAAEVLSTVTEAAGRNLAGSLFYDALILACARKAGASVIYTYDLGHFAAVAPDLANRLRLP